MPERSSVRRRSRDVRAVDSYAGAAAAIGKVEPGMHVFLVTRGQFSMLDMIRHVLAELGPSALSVWTWTIEEYDVDLLGSLLELEAITAGRVVVDRGTEGRRPISLLAWRSKFGPDSVRLCRNHSKMARVWNSRLRVLIRGSMNLNLNPRFEQADITEGGADFSLVQELEDGLPMLAPGCANTEADTATGTGKAWERSSLPMFGGLQVWAK